MNKTHYERRSHEQGNYEITPTYTGTVSEEPVVVPVNPDEDPEVDPGTK